MNARVEIAVRADARFNQAQIVTIRRAADKFAGLLESFDTMERGVTASRRVARVRPLAPALPDGAGDAWGNTEH